jgi:hypothetical protein
MQVRIDQAARVRLAHGCELRAGALVDERTGLSHPLSELGLEVVSRLDGTRTLATLVDELSVLYVAEPATIGNDLLRFLGELDRHAMLAVPAPSPAERAGVLAWTVAHPQVALLGAWVRLMGDDRPPSRRYGQGVRGVVAATTRSQIVLLASLLALSALGGAASALAAPPQTHDQLVAMRALVLAPLALVAAHLSLLWAHELGHLTALRRFRVPVFYAFRRGFRVGVAHERATPAQERWVSLAGPAAAVAAGGLLTLLLWATPFRRDYVPQVMAVFPLVLGLVHVLALVPWAADGAQLFRRAPAAAADRRP